MPQDDCLRLTEVVSSTIPAPAGGRSATGHGDRVMDRMRRGEVRRERDATGDEAGPVRSAGP
ncbi:hypothetical protein ACQVP2_02355 [Methylobacterium aquaticum]|uniref:hypothetical protein n=1 Tax=Methylobacterium aquaticum TaxID=270351 RepID=UPI003D1727B2